LRKQYLIDRKFQLRFSLELLIFVVVTPFIVWANIYMLGQYSHSQDIYAQGAMTNWGIIGVLFQQRWWLLLLLYLTNFGIFYFIILYYSHRVAGPIYKCTKALDAIAAGNIGGKIKLRKRDYFESLSDSINTVVKNYGDDITGLKDAMDMLRSKASSGSDSELKKAVEQMDTILSRYNFDETDAEQSPEQAGSPAGTADAQANS
jgi:methyl-accepting chemotaxis protein